MPCLRCVFSSGTSLFVTHSCLLGSCPGLAVPLSPPCCAAPGSLCPSANSQQPSRARGWTEQALLKSYGLKGTGVASSTSAPAPQHFCPPISFLDVTHPLEVFLIPPHPSPALHLSGRLSAKLLQLCPTLYDTKDCSLPGSSVHGILQARILESVAVSFSRRSSPPRDGTPGLFCFCIGRRVLYHWLHGFNPWSLSGGLPA